MKARHIPLRTCLGCRQARAKSEMVRLVRTPSGEVMVTHRGQMPGRGAYLCRRLSCWEGAFNKDRVGHALKLTLSPSARSRLLEEARALVSQAFSASGISDDLERSHA